MPESDSAEYGDVSLLEEAQQVGARRGSNGILDDLDEGTSPPIRPGREVTGPKKTVQPQIVLVCADCEAYYEHKETWAHCPQCAEELLEVEKA